VKALILRQRDANHDCVTFQAYTAIVYNKNRHALWPRIFSIVASANVFPPSHSGCWGCICWCCQGVSVSEIRMLSFTLGFGSSPRDVHWTAGVSAETFPFPFLKIRVCVHTYCSCFQNLASWIEKKGVFYPLPRRPADPPRQMRWTYVLCNVYILPRISAPSF